MDAPVFLFLPEHWVHIGQIEEALFSMTCKRAAAKRIQPRGRTMHLLLWAALHGHRWIITRWYLLYRDDVYQYLWCICACLLSRRDVVQADYFLSMFTSFGSRTLSSAYWQWGMETALAGTCGALCAYVDMRAHRGASDPAVNALLETPEATQMRSIIRREGICQVRPDCLAGALQWAEYAGVWRPWPISSV